MAARGRRRTRLGRPPRTDDPIRLGMRLPGAMYEWLKRRSQAEGRAQSEIVVAALRLYQRSVARRRKP